ncbi:FISUMP domain-containing protein [Fibrobacter sp.]
MTDDRDGHVYKTVELGCKWWMAENLAFDSENSFEGKYGRLYEWGALADACPFGWHVSTVDEWQDLINRVHKEFRNNAVLRSTTGWDVDSSRIDDEEWGGNVKGTDGLGFSIFPDGYVYYGEGGTPRYEGVGSAANFWTVDYIQSDRDVVVFDNHLETEFMDATDPDAYSVRCVKD